MNGNLNGNHCFDSHAKTDNKIVNNNSNENIYNHNNKTNNFSAKDEWGAEPNTSGAVSNENKTTESKTIRKDNNEWGDDDDVKQSTSYHNRETSQGKSTDKYSNRYSNRDTTRDTKDYRENREDRNYKRDSYSNSNRRDNYRDRERRDSKDRDYKNRNDKDYTRSEKDYSKSKHSNTRDSFRDSSKDHNRDGNRDFNRDSKYKYNRFDQNDKYRSNERNSNSKIINGSSNIQLSEFTYSVNNTNNNNSNINSNAYGNQNTSYSNSNSNYNNGYKPNNYINNTTYENKNYISNSNINTNSNFTNYKDNYSNVNKSLVIENNTINSHVNNNNSSSINNNITSVPFSSDNYLPSLLRNQHQMIPNDIKAEYEDLLHAHKRKKPVEHEFFNQKATDYIATFNGEPISLEFENKKQVTFSSVKNFHSTLTSNLLKLNFTYLTAIQQTTIPLALAGKDVIGCSDTGSGKTLAFLLPILSQLISKPEKLPHHSSLDNRRASPIVLILSPTRELTEQINEECRKVIVNTGLHSVAIYGGIKGFEQRTKLRHNCEILVSTTGRLADSLKKGQISLKHVQYVVLDEADRMLDMGFLPQVEEIFTKFDLPEKHMRQNLMFSATFDNEIKTIARKFMNEFYFITNGNGTDNKDNVTFNPVNVASTHYKLINSDAKKWKVKENIEQVMIPAIDDNYKINFIVDKILKKECLNAIVFVDLKTKADEIQNCLRTKYIRATSIHGNKTQENRNDALDSFKAGKYQVIVATNVLSRGIDIAGIDYVFNFDLPLNIDDYIHRIGRTGRLGNKGHAVTFISVNDREKKIMRELITYLRKCEVVVPEWLGCLFPDLAALGTAEEGTFVNSSFNSTSNFNNNQEDGNSSFRGYGNRGFRGRGRGGYNSFSENSRGGRGSFRGNSNRDFNSGNGSNTGDYNNNNSAYGNNGNFKPNRENFNTYNNDSSRYNNMNVASSSTNSFTNNTNYSNPNYNSNYNRSNNLELKERSNDNNIRNSNDNYFNNKPFTSCNNYRNNSFNDNSNSNYRNNNYNNNRNEDSMLGKKRENEVSKNDNDW